MNKPIVKLSLILLIPLLVLLWLEINLPKVSNSYKQKRNVFNENATKVETVFLGSSQALYGVKPEMLPNNTINLANLNQDLYYDHQWLMQYIDSMPRVKTIFLTFTYFTLGYELQTTKENWRTFFYQRYWNLKGSNDDFNIRNYSCLALYGPRISLSFALHGFTDPNNQIFSALGHQSLDSTRFLKSSPQLGKQAVAYHHGFFRQGAMEDNKIRIFEMAELCRERGVNFVILQTPLHYTYRNNCAPWILAYNSKFLSGLKERQKAIILDFSSSKEFSDSCFFDEFHLNAKGATKLTSLIRKTKIR